MFKVFRQQLQRFDHSWHATGPATVFLTNTSFDWAYTEIPFTTNKECIVKIDSFYHEGVMAFLQAKEAIS